MSTADLLAKLLAAAQVLALPLLSALLAFAWDTWKKSRAVYDAMFGNPNVKGDDGLVGEIKRHREQIEALERRRLGRA